jgi:hypothetical protein
VERSGFALIFLVRFVSRQKEHAISREVIGQTLAMVSAPQNKNKHK